MLQGASNSGNCTATVPVDWQKATFTIYMRRAAVTALILAASCGRQRGLATLKGVCWLHRGCSVTFASSLRLSMRMLSALSPFDR